MLLSLSIKVFLSSKGYIIINQEDLFLFIGLTLLLLYRINLYKLN